MYSPGPLEDIKATSSSGNTNQGKLEELRKFYLGKPPVKFKFHFPEEVWTKILNLLTDDKDRTNCCRASPYFDELLTKSKPVWLFKQILPLLAEKDLLESSDLLTSRGVCKQWSDDIQNHLFDHGCQSYFKKDMYPFKSVDEIDSFRKAFESHSRSGRSPFVDRTVLIKIGREEEFRNKLLELFSHFGSHVWTLGLGFECGAASISTEYNFVQQILTKTPNLKELSITGINTTIYPDMEDFPLPTISSLTLLHLNTCNCDLTKELTKPKSFIYMLACNIRSLYIQYNKPSSVISLPRLINAFEKFPVLERVDIRGGTIDTDVDIGQVRNSTVRFLTVQISDPISCDFLQAFELLEELIVFLKLSKEAYLGKDAGELQFYKMLEEGQLYESNIWTLIPTLQLVRLLNFNGKSMDKTVGNKAAFEYYNSGN